MSALPLVEPARHGASSDAAASCGQTKSGLRILELRVRESGDAAATSAETAIGGGLR